MKVIKEINSIRGKLFLNGKGFINGDGSDQKYHNKELNLYGGSKGYLYDNVKYHKKIYNQKPSDHNKYEFKYKISNEAIRHAMFIKEMPHFNQQIQCIPSVYYNALASPCMIARGYMFPEIYNDRRKSPITVTAGVMEGEWMNCISLETCSRTGFKKGSNEVEYTNADNEKSKITKNDTSLYYMENVGNCTYVSDFGIDLCESQFIPTDIIFDRRAVDLSETAIRNLYMSALKRNFNVDNIDMGYFYSESAVMGEEHAEEGIRLTPEMNDMLVKIVLKKMCDIYIDRPANGGLLCFDHMDFVCYTSDGEEYEITIRSKKDIDQYVFLHHTRYLPADFERIKERARKMDEVKSMIDKKIKEKAEVKATAKKAKTNKE